MVEYTIAVCNYNMAETVEESIRSIDSLVDDRFEIVIIDDSSDGSRAILRRIEGELHRVRLVEGSNENIGEARASAVDHARGEYVLHQLDADDKYTGGIIDFVTIFHQIESQVQFDPFLSGQHIHMGSRSLLRKVNYRSLGYNEDRDFWRRMIIHGSFIGIRHKPIRESIGYGREGIEKAATRFEAIVTQFRSGITLSSYLVWLLKKPFTVRLRDWQVLLSIAFNLAAAPLAFVIASRAGIYELPEEYSDMSKAETALRENIMTLSEIESHYGIDIDRSKLSETGRDIFDCDPRELQPPRLWLNQPADLSAPPRER